MSKSLILRGPDDSGQWLRETVGLASRRLSIIDVEHGHQPMSTEDGSIVLVFNGEIYNAAEIRSDLRSRGIRFQTRCDTEVVLQAWAEFGEAAVERFNGMFAFAVYDVHRDRLTLVRDRLGIKPLYYTVRNGTLAFSSELDSLLKSGFVTPEIDRAALEAYFTLLYVPGEHCIFRDVRKLAPGEMGVFEQGRFSRRQYWQPVFDIDDSWTLDSAAERFRELFSDSVRLRKASDVPLGAFLSGGVDSSVLVAALAELSEDPVNTFTIGFDDEIADERRYARLVADRFGTRHSEIVVKPDYVDLLSKTVRHFGEPFADSSALPTYLVSKLAREKVTVALSGDGGDELFAGYTWTHMNRHVSRYRRFPASLRRVGDRLLAFGPDGPLLSRIRRFSGDSFLDFKQSFLRRQTCFSDDQRALLLLNRDGGAAGYRVPDESAPVFEGTRGRHEDNWMLEHDLRGYLPGDILTKVDRMSMAVSLEARVPFLDHRLVEFACTVPFHLKYRFGKSKRLVKHAFATTLPRETLRQRKRGFSLPVHRWFREDLSQYFYAVVLSADARSANFLDLKYVNEIYQAHLAGRADHGHHLWAVLVFEHWLAYAHEALGAVPDIGRAA